MKMNKKISIQGNYAKKGEDIKDGDIITILDGGTVVQGQFGEQKTFLVKVVSGEDMLLSLNQTSENNLIDVFGDESENWVNKQVKAFVMPQMVKGKRSLVLYLADPSWDWDEDGDLVPKK